MNKTMIKNLKYLYILITMSVSFVIQSQRAFAVVEKVEGLEYIIRKIDDVPLEKYIKNNYDLYELYLENRSDKTFSIPGYSVDLGVNYSNLSEINSLYNEMSSKKSTVFNIAAGAASIALGGIARRAASTVVRTVGSFRHKNSNLITAENFLSNNKTYILYPDDGLSLYLLVGKYLTEVPHGIRFICHDEDTNVNYIVINNNVEVRNDNVQKVQKEINVQNVNHNSSFDKSGENIIIAPSTEQYK